MGVRLGINSINMAKFNFNNGQEFDVYTIEDIARCPGEYIRGFDFLEITSNHVLIYHRNDPLGIRIGEVFGLSEGRISLR